MAEENSVKIDLKGITVGMLIAALAIMIFNNYQISRIGLPATTTVVQPVVQQSQPAQMDGVQMGGVQMEGIDVSPKGTPNIYGGELGVSYDDVTPNNPKADSTIKKIGMLDDQIKLDGANLERYKKIALQISCEYCCGADSIIFPDGKAACGCAHSYAMRGLAKYLLKNHANEFTDDQILEEMAKWKVLFFPQIMAKKAAVMQQKGIETNYINLGSNKYRGIENA
ncbi:hypothetical protein HY486_04020 [Candidatus Woesearchaeota archaeon]|nr:hypothetical protein [Candidatus Woesearchaeota archaeon]